MKTHVFGNLFYFVRFAITFHIGMGSLPLGDKDEEKYKNVLFYEFLFLPVIKDEKFACYCKG